MVSELAYTGIVVAFDLDDTLYSEAQYAQSGYRAVAAMLADEDMARATSLVEIMTAARCSAENPFDALAEYMQPKQRDEFISRCVETYRAHWPDIKLYAEASRLLGRLSESGVRLALVTDGATSRQMAKISALGLDRYFPADNIFISETVGVDKLNIRSWQSLVRRYPNARRFVSIGDNPAKDFYYPNRLGWLTIGVRDKGWNIHPQDIAVADGYAPQIWSDSLSEVLTILNSI